MTVDPSGRFAFVANQFSDDVTTFSIDPSTGALSEVVIPGPAGDAPRSVTVDPSGRFAYVANEVSDDELLKALEEVARQIVGRHR